MRTTFEPQKTHLTALYILPAPVRGSHTNVRDAANAYLNVEKAYTPILERLAAPDGWVITSGIMHRC